jgi:hypothetical protein
MPEEGNQHFHLIYFFLADFQKRIKIMLFFLPTNNVEHFIISNLEIHFFFIPVNSKNKITVRVSF